MAALQRFDRFWADVHHRISEWLDILPGSRVLDAGSGTGGFTRLLAEAVGDGGQVSALDINLALLNHVHDELETSVYGERLTYHSGDASDMPFPDEHFDLVWCSRVVHRLPDQLAAVRELARVTKAGGRVVLREGGVPLRLLPYDFGQGKPGLEGRLPTQHSEWFHDFSQRPAEQIPYPFGWTQMLVDAGLHTIQARTFLLELLPPFNDYQVDYLRHYLARLLAANEGHLDEADRDALFAIASTQSEHYALNRSDLHVISGTSVYVGVK
jgi:ubiquinone/menaquinone biosynthesis C-methylase UbiE